METRDSLKTGGALQKIWQKSGGLALAAGVLLLAGCASSNMPATVAQGKLYVAVPFSPPSGNGRFCGLTARPC